MHREQLTGPKVWENGDIGVSDAVATFSPEAREELAEAARFAVLAMLHDSDFSGDEFRAIAGVGSVGTVLAEMDRIRTDYLDKTGIVIVDRILPDGLVDLSAWSPDDIATRNSDAWEETAKWKSHMRLLKTAIALVSYQLGDTLLHQGEPDETGTNRMVHVKEVRDRSMEYGTGSGHTHYSDGKQGGNYHTDGAERPELPWALPLYMVRQSRRGGDTVVRSIYPTHNRLLASHPNELAALYENFWVDTREPDTQPFQKSVFSIGPQGDVRFSYLRKYIEAGHDLAGVPLNKDQIRALDILDADINDVSRYVRLHLNPGQLFVSDNFSSIHGRPPEGYEDSTTDPREVRTALRSWVYDSNLMA